ncbi:hypothetical protein FUA48_11065 [Flavobacterium alkalisoli]|uniref:Uncharacterized protein n=1 Tax=Flavobacterium alkalisoli TaxID=2602769 RepID=A0A5B9FUZ0_9FLAO|nr:hypothetical protein [Flavobacterium alkalisoli]QEE50099.1 hypothetical protein FUA48_11065 [Flavobacterium alkalisoli]
MKKHLTLLLLLVSVCFYGQEFADGFYISAFNSGYPILYKDHKGNYKEVELIFNKDEITKRLEKLSHYVPFYIQFEGFTDADGRFTVNEILKIDRTYTADIITTKQGLEVIELTKKTTAFDAQGFCIENNDRLAFFKLEDGKLSAPAVLILSDNNISLPKGFTSGRLIKVKGRLSSGFIPYPEPDIYPSFFGHDSWKEILATEVTLTNDNQLLEDYLEKQSGLKSEPIQKEQAEYFEGELFITTNFEFNSEQIYAMVPENGDLVNKGGVIFSDAIKEIPKLQFITTFVPHLREAHEEYLTHGILIKAKGLRIYGNPYALNNQFMYRYFIWDIEKVDVSKTLWDYKAKTVAKRGFFGKDDEKQVFPANLQENKQYTFKEQKDGHSFMLMAKRKGGYVHYTFTAAYENKKVTQFTGKLLLDPGCYLFVSSTETDSWYREVYESTEPDRYVKGNSLFTLYVLSEKDENGNIKIGIKNSYNTSPITIELTEVKN